MNKTAGRVGAGVLLFTGASFAMSTLGPDGGGPPRGPSADSEPRITNLAAEPRAAREGDRVQFVAEATDSLGTTLTYTWDFGDDSGERTGPDLSTISHRYLDDRSPFEVRLRVENSDGGTDEGSVKVDVKNVPPEIRSLDREGAALVGGELSFAATVTDPGVRDELVYSWDFGDGTASEGVPVTHAYDETGTYEVVLVVRDGDGGEDRETHTVVVGEGFEFTVGGDVSGVQSGSASIYGVTAGDNARSVQLRKGYCSLIVSFEPEDGRSRRPGLSFTASVRGALRSTEYAFGNDETVEIWADENATPNHFFAGLRNDGAFVSRSGALTITYLDESRVEGVFSLNMKEQPPFANYPERRSASVSGHFAAPLVDRPLPRGGTRDFYQCRPDAIFDIAERTPASDAENVDPERPDLELTFTEALDVSSVKDAIRVEYRTADGQYRAVPGSWEQEGDERTIRFVPTGILLDGVIHCIRVRAGEGGVRGLAGEVLEHAPPRWDGDHEDAACGAGVDWEESREWALPTLVELENLRVDLFQVSKIEDGIALVPDKPTVARVHATWTEKQGVHPTAQVKEFGADVRVEADERAVYPPKTRVTIRRPDQFDEDDLRLARNSVNFFGWKPRTGGSSTVVATLEPVEQERTPPRRFESTPVDAEHWSHAPTFTFDYYFLRIGRWATGVPAEERASGELLAKRAELTTTQMFPVVATRGHGGGDFFDFDLAQENLAAEAKDTRKRIQVDEAGVTSEQYRGIIANLRLTDLGTLVRIFHDAVAPHTDATALVAFHPTSFNTGGASLRDPLLDEALDAYDRRDAGQTVEIPYAFRTVRMAVRSDIYLTTALTHEFGHAFWLEHEPFVASGAHRQAECAKSRGLYPDIEGFRVAAGGQRGWNKSSTEGNGESTSRLYPLMYPCTQRTTESFPLNRQYRELQEQVGRAIQRGTWSGGPLVHGPAYSPARDRPHQAELASTGVLELFRPTIATATHISTSRREPEEVLHVSGFVSNDGQEAVLAYLQRSPRARHRTSAMETPFRLELQDETGRVLGSAPLDIEQKTNSDLGWRWFSTALPLPENTTRVVIMRDEDELGSRVAGANVPAVRFVTPADGEAQSGPVEVRWEGGDPDGSDLLYTLLYSPTGGLPWRVFGLPSSRTSATIDVDRLAPGPNPTLRVIASDGFHETTVDMPVELDGRLRVLATLPVDGTSDADPIAGVQVFFGSEVVEEEAAGAVRITGPGGTTVSADARLLSGGRTLALSPLAPFDPGTRYSVTIEAGLTDGYGNRLDSPVSWAFTIADATDEAAAKTLANGDEPDGEDVGDGEENVQADRPDEAAADHLGHGGTRWVAVRVADDDGLSFHGSSVDGAAAAEMICLIGHDGIFRIYDAGRRNEATRVLSMSMVGAVSEDPTTEGLTVNIQYHQPGGGELFQANDVPLKVLRNEATTDPDRRRFAARIRGAVLRARSSDRRIQLDVDFEVNAACRRFRIGG